ncbi:methyltransferase [Methyloligella sp. 2.7D]|uniref:tRNA1(Val) (adenine(37)-N6)-methyltransferase n=1 Tax=unclassified Methyloligella TaxID=2625955 RepID=UPI00157C179A|nr:methyltransferase [Methyloligella sp. GL2]QKP78292.1 methyltransferase [Methyloligella sp. GL2]
MSQASNSEVSGAATSLDGFLGGRFHALQPRTGHRAGSDTVFLAAAAIQDAAGGNGGEGLRILDAGAGAGVAGLCLLSRFPSLQVTAVETDPALCALARQNGERNGFSERYGVIEADVTAPGKRLAETGLARESFSHVIANPPYYRAGSVRSAPEAEKAHVMAEGGLAAWVRFLTAMAAARAALTIIHRPEVLPELLQLLQPRFGALRVFPLFAKPGAPASRILVRGIKGRRGGLELLPGLVLHDGKGGYTPPAEAVLRAGAPLFIS